MCNCCGSTTADVVPVGIPDESGHIWTHCLCARCSEHCTNDENGNPIHMSDEWDGSPETFEACRLDRQTSEAS